MHRERADSHVAADSPAVAPADRKSPEDACRSSPPHEARAKSSGGPRRPPMSAAGPRTRRSFAAAASRLKHHSRLARPHEQFRLDQCVRSPCHSSRLPRAYARPPMLGRQISSQPARRAPPDPNEAPIRSSDVVDEGVLDRTPTDSLANERLHGRMDVRSSHRLGSVGQDLRYGVDHPARTMRPLPSAQGSSWLATAPQQFGQLPRQPSQA